MQKSGVNFGTSGVLERGKDMTDQFSGDGSFTESAHYLPETNPEAGQHYRQRYLDSPPPTASPI